jgi:hypothetical protein
VKGTGRGEAEEEPEIQEEDPQSHRQGKRDPSSSEQERKSHGRVPPSTHVKIIHQLSFYQLERLMERLNAQRVSWSTSSTPQRRQLERLGAPQRPNAAAVGTAGGRSLTKI